MVEGIHLQVNMNTAIELSKSAGDLEASLAAQQMEGDEDIRKESIKKSEQVNKEEASEKANADAEGSGGGGNEFGNEEETEEKKEAAPKDPFRGSILDITR